MGEDVFSAHRVMLLQAAIIFTPCLHMAVKESHEDVVELKDESISTAALKIMLDSIYGRGLDVNDKNVFEVRLAVDHLQVTCAVQQCCIYLETEFAKCQIDVQTYWVKS